MVKVVTASEHVHSRALQKYHFCWYKSIFFSLPRNTRDHSRAESGCSLRHPPCHHCSHSRLYRLSSLSPPITFSLRTHAHTHVAHPDPFSIFGNARQSFEISEYSKSFWNGCFCSVTAKHTHIKSYILKVFSTNIFYWQSGNQLRALFQNLRLKNFITNISYIQF